MTFDPNKPVQTESGLPARIIATDVKGKFPIIALVLMHDGLEAAFRYTAEGHNFDRRAMDMFSGKGRHPLDLVNIPDREEYFVLVSVKSIKDGISQKRAVDCCRETNAYFPIKITYENGKLIAVELVRESEEETNHE